ncbi:hypothetical protein QBC40DRAFT_201648 [Triangularia verruculosa]|uniref:N-acetyltransferase domain-containing protein n=1 Tax=Triangularia verruculosa TaxID=2587418 RepID=A0AAN6XK79_9PEZI|nr:hypothetical protein QBC40DRAFT_201648 [Triangularia verruculosa]
MKPRLGLPVDIEAVTDIIIRTMPLDPQWDYRFPYRHEFPDDHYKFTRLLFEYFLDPAYDDWQVMVVEDSPEEVRGERRVVSFSVWDVSYRNKRRYGPSYVPQDRKSSIMLSSLERSHTNTPNEIAVTEVEKQGGRTRRDANHEHFDAFWRGQIAAYKAFFSKIGPEQIHLQILATLPDFQRRGHASSLCKWGMRLVHQDRLNDISVMASPMGHDLYRWLGFALVGTFYIQVPEEEERLTLHAMKYVPDIKLLRVIADNGQCGLM